MNGFSAGIQAASQARSENQATQRNMMQLIFQTQAEQAKQRAAIKAESVSLDKQLAARREESELDNYWTTVRNQMDNESAMQRALMEDARIRAVESAKLDQGERKMQAESYWKGQELQKDYTKLALDEKQHQQDVDQRDVHFYAGEQSKWNLEYVKHQWSQQDDYKTFFSKYMADGGWKPEIVAMAPQWADQILAGNTDAIALLTALGMSPKEARAQQQADNDTIRTELAIHGDQRDEARLGLDAEKFAWNKQNDKANMLLNAQRATNDTVSTYAGVATNARKALEAFQKQFDDITFKQAYEKGGKKLDDLKMFLRSKDVLDNRVAAGKIDKDTYNATLIQMKEQFHITKEDIPFIDKYDKLSGIAEHAEAMMLQNIPGMAPQDNEELYQMLSQVAPEDPNAGGLYEGLGTMLGAKTAGLQSGSGQRSAGTGFLGNIGISGVAGDLVSGAAGLFGADTAQKEKLRRQFNPLEMLREKGVRWLYGDDADLNPNEKNEAMLTLRDAFIKKHKRSPSGDEMAAEYQKFISMDGVARMSYISDEAVVGNRSAKEALKRMDAVLRPQQDEQETSTYMAPIAEVGGSFAGKVGSAFLSTRVGQAAAYPFKAGGRAILKMAGKSSVAEAMPTFTKLLKSQYKTLSKEPPAKWLGEPWSEGYPTPMQGPQANLAQDVANTVGNIPQPTGNVSGPWSAYPRATVNTPPGVVKPMLALPERSSAGIPMPGNSTVFDPPAQTSFLGPYGVDTGMPHVRPMERISPVNGMDSFKAMGAPTSLQTRAPVQGFLGAVSPGRQAMAASSRLTQANVAATEIPAMATQIAQTHPDPGVRAVATDIAQASRKTILVDMLKAPEGMDTLQAMDYILQSRMKMLRANPYKGVPFYIRGSKQAGQVFIEEVNGDMVRLSGQTNFIPFKSLREAKR